MSSHDNYQIADDFPSPAHQTNLAGRQHARRDPGKIEVDGHMCPECGFTGDPWCQGCYGAGIVSGERLAQLQAGYTEQMRCGQ